MTKGKKSHTDKNNRMGQDNTNTNNKGADNNNDDGDQGKTNDEKDDINEGPAKQHNPAPTTTAVSNCLQGGKVCEDGDDHEMMVGTKTKPDYRMTRAPGMVTAEDSKGDENETTTMMAITTAPPTACRVETGTGTRTRPGDSGIVSVRKQAQSPIR